MWKTDPDQPAVSADASLLFLCLGQGCIPCPAYTYSPRRRVGVGVGEHRKRDERGREVDNLYPDQPKP